MCKVISCSHVWSTTGTSMYTTKLPLPHLIGVPAKGGESSEEDVGQDAQAPDVGGQRDGLQAQDLGG